MDPQPEPCQCGHDRDHHRERLYECLSGGTGPTPDPCRCELYIPVGEVVAAPAKAPTPRAKKVPAALPKVAKPRTPRGAKKR